MKVIKFEYSFVRDFVKNNSECELLSKEYKDTKSKLSFKCKCGEHFETSFGHFKGRNKRQCNKCGREMRDKKDRTSYIDVKTYIEETNNSQCKLLSPESVYKNHNSQITILCGCGNPFVTNFGKFKFRNKQRCNQCSYNNIREFFTYTYDYVKDYIETNSKCVLISKEYVSCIESLELQCHCGRHFNLSFTSFKRRKGKQCDYCNNLFSVGENTIEEFLIKYGVKYKTQYSFDDLPASHGKYKLRFDFVVLNNDDTIRCLIEFDGRQHYMPVEYFGGIDAYNKLKENDEAKEKYCKKNKYMLIRIPYYDMDNICEILKNKLQITMAIPSQAC